MHLPEPVQRAFAKLDQPTDAYVRNYLTLRKLIGILGLALPVVLYAGARWLFTEAHQATISAYYYTGMRDVFVGILWAIGVFLVCYKGAREWDNVASTVAGACAILVALFPTDKGTAAHTFAGHVHIYSAAAFFLTITLMTLFLFRNRGKKAWTNWIYRLCGGAMALSLVVMFFTRVSFLWEAVAVVAFGAAWLVNGVEKWKAPEDRPRKAEQKAYSAFA